MPNGAQVDIRKAQKAAQERYIAAFQNDPRAAVTFPLVDLIEPSVIQKAVFSANPDDLRFRLPEQIQKAQNEFVDALNTEVDTNILQKATTSSSNLMHSISDADVTFLFKNVYPLQALIDVEANTGKIAQWDAIPPYGAGSASFVSENPPLTESDITDYVRTDSVKILSTDGVVTKMARVAGLAQVPARDMMSIRTMASMEMIKRLRERAMLGVTRDVTTGTTSFVSAGALEYKGLYEMIRANDGTGDAKTQNFEVASAGVSAYKDILALLEKSYQKMITVGLNPNLIVADFKTFNIFRQGLNDFFRSENMVDTTFGISKLSLAMPGGIVPMLPHFYLPSTAGANGSCFLLDTTYLKRRVLWPETYLELAQINTAQRYVVDAAEVLIDKTDVDGKSSLQGGVFGITVS
jgi:hypothetical protein